MAITHESTGAGAYADLGATGPGTISWSHTSSGGADCVVLIGFAISPDVTSSNYNRLGYTATVTYGGTNAVFAGYSGVGANDQFGTVYWYSIQNPPTGAQTVQVSITYISGIGQTLHGTSVSYKGVRNIHRVQQYRAQGSTATITVPSKTGRKLVHVGANSGTTLTSYNQNMLASDTTNQSVVMGDANGASSVTFSWSRGSSGAYGSCVLELIPTTEPQATVSLRSIGEGVRATGSSTTLGASWTHRHDKVSAGFSIAIVAVEMSLGDGTSVTCAVTYGGQAMTQLALTSSGFSLTRNAVGFYALDDPPLGLSTVNVTTGGDMTKYQVLGCSVIYENVRLVANTGSVESLNVTATGVPLGGRVITVNANGNIITDTSHTEIYRGGAGTTGAGDYGWIQETVGTGSNITITHTGTASVPLTHALTIYPNMYSNDFFHLLG